ncbi:hypothetical protein VF12_37790 [Nostoc linckia z15]|nr:hypothetical protein VF12_37790 [Nostoc linckia z15]
MISIESLAELMLWQMQQLDALMGAYPIEIEIEDSDLVKEGNQKQKIIADILSRYINHVVPFVLIGLGVFIVLKSEALSPIKLAASCFCLVILVKNNEIEDNSST